MLEDESALQQPAVAAVTVATSDAIADLLIGQSSAIKNIVNGIQQVAGHRYTSVLLQGESGTGKDVVAQAIHRLTNHSIANFIPINCAAIPENLLETELFGVEAGAYTDAKTSRDGYIVRANHGTLFLDEIGSMPLLLQAKLLRFLETRSFRRVGSTKEQHVSLRVISATNVDLQTAVTQKTFRDDLFYRLKVFSITIPPLRDRREDIPLLIDHFLQTSMTQRAEPLAVSEEALYTLMHYSWPGNIRQLRSIIEYCQILCRGNIIQRDDLPEEVLKPDVHAGRQLQEIRQQMHLPEAGIDLPTFLSSIEYSFIQEALARCNGNQVHAAALLNMTRDQLRYRLRLGRNSTRKL